MAHAVRAAIFLHVILCPYPCQSVVPDKRDGGLLVNNSFAWASSRKGLMSYSARTAITSATSDLIGALSYVRCATAVRAAIPHALYSKLPKNRPLFAPGPIVIVRTYT